MDSLRKAAILLASIPEAESAALMSRLSATQIEELSKATQALDSFTADQQRQLAAELVDLRYRSARVDDTSAVCHAGCSDWNAESQIELERLQVTSSEWLATQLADELPQTAAVVVCHLQPALAAKTLASLPTEMQLEVTKRIVGFESVPKDVAQQLLSTLSTRLRSERLSEVNAGGGLAFVAQVIQRLDHATERALLENLAQDDRALVERLLKLIFLLRDRKRACDQLQSAGEDLPTAESRAA